MLLIIDTTCYDVFTPQERGDEMNIAKLKGLIAEREIKKSYIADMLGVSKVTMSKRLKDGSFTVEEMRTLIKGLKMTEEEIKNIFLN